MYKNLPGKDRNKAMRGEMETSTKLADFCKLFVILKPLCFFCKKHFFNHENLIFVNGKKEQAKA